MCDRNREIMLLLQFKLFIKTKINNHFVHSEFYMLETVF